MIAGQRNRTDGRNSTESRFRDHFVQRFNLDLCCPPPLAVTATASVPNGRTTVLLDWHDSCCQSAGDGGQCCVRELLLVLVSAILRKPPISLSMFPFLSQLLSNGKSPTRPKLALVPSPRLLTDFGGKFHAGQALPNRAGCRSLTGWGSQPHLSTCCFGSRDRSEIAGGSTSLPGLWTIDGKGVLDN